MRVDAILAWCVLTAAVLSQSDSRPAADFSTEGMTRRAAELLPLVEEESGLKAGAPIVVRAASRQDMGAVLLEEAVLFREGMRSTARGPLLRSILKEQTGLLGRAVFAKVEATTGVVFVVPTNVKQRAEHPDIGERIVGQEFLDSLLIHETVHVLQHRRDPLPAFFDAPRSADELQCRNTVAEGFADWVSRRVHRRLGREDAMEFMRTAQRSFPEEVVAASNPRDLAFLRAYQFSSYVEGERFFDAVEKRLGRAAALERVLAAPPRSRAEIANPAAYAADDARVLDEETIGESLRLAIPSPPWERESIGLPEDALRADLEGAGAALAEAAVAEVVGGALVGGKESLRALDPNNELAAKILFARSPEGATKLFEAHLAAEKSEDEDHRAGRAPDELVSAEYVDVVPPPAGADAAVRATRTLKPERKKAYASTALLARRGDVFVAIGATATSAKPEALDDLAAKALEIAASRPSRAPASRRAAPLPDVATTKVRGAVRWKKGEGGPAVGTVRIWTGSPGRRVLEAAIKDGAFEADVPDVASARFGSVFADGERFEDVVGSKPKLDDAGACEIKLPKPDYVAVVVVDAATSRPVRDAVAYPAAYDYEFASRSPEGPWTYVDVAASSETGAVHGDEDGRLRLPRNGRYWRIVGRGAAATQLDATNQAIGELSPEPVRFELSPGGSLRATVPNRKKLGEATVSLRALRRKADGDYELQFGRELKLGDHGVAEAHGLPPGTYVLLLRQGGKHWSGPIAASADAVVVAGRTTEVALNPPATDDLADLKIVLTAPEGGGWNGTFELELRRAGTDDDAFEKQLRFSRAKLSAEATFEALTPGTYEARLDEGHFVANVEVRAGAEPVAIALPPLVDVVLKATDAETGAPIKGFTHSSRRAAAGRKSWQWDRREFSPARATGAKFKVVAGAAEVELEHADYLETTFPFDVVAPGPAEVTVPMKPAGRIKVRVKTGVAGDLKGVEARIKSSDGSTTRTSTIGRDRVATFGSLAAGRWTVDFDDADDYETSPPVEVEVKARETAEVELTLDKKGG